MTGERRSGTLIDAAHAGELLDVPASWVLAQARRDRIPHVRFGRYVRFDPRELEAWWQDQMRGLTARPGLQPVPRALESP